MASEKDLELLDQYVSNRLTGQERTAFENKLASDTSLKNEFQIQERVVAKIREARVKELKTMFNSIPASELETGGTSVITQVALWLALAGAIGLGVYFYLDSQGNDVRPDLSKQEQAENGAPQSADPQHEQPQREEGAAATQDDKPAAEEEITAPSETKEDQEVAQAPELKTDEQPKGPAPIDVFDPTEETKEPGERRNPSGVSEATPLTKSSIVVETDNSNKKYDFHYQFKEGKLFLYGTFEKNLYEIMEFFSDNKRTVFLFYKDNYYLLNEDNDAVKPLSPINDPTLLKKLKDYRGTR
jgi:hypothetical protein